jgi:signal transduction histidine kinase
MREGRSALWFPLTFAVVVLSFLGATALAQFRALAFDQAALAIMVDAVPSIQTLSASASGVQDVQLVLEEQLDVAEHGGAPDPAAIEGARQAVDRSMNDYLALPFFPGEVGVWRAISKEKGAFDETVSRFESELRRGDLEQARSTLRTEFRQRIAAVRAAISSSVELNASYTYDQAAEIRRLRTSTTRMSFGLDVIGIAVAVFGAFLLSKVVREQTKLMQQHARLEEERATELEQFAGRIAHDILSPLDAVGTALYLTGTVHDEEQRARALGRGTKTLQRVKKLVDGLLDFARAGATADPRARADVRMTMSDLAADLQPAAVEAGIELRMDADGVRFVRCHSGVLTSLIANLVRNSIKYMGDARERRIEVRALDRDDWVRVEVEDTGPGLAPEVAPRVFEPYVRGRGLKQPGIGLGLATVKRLAESHGGLVGVRSAAGRGSTFWFELPKAADPVPDHADASVVGAEKHA